MDLMGACQLRCILFYSKLVWLGKLYYLIPSSIPGFEFNSKGLI